MTVCHMLLGRPWQFDKKAIHDGYSNAYTFTVKDKKFELRPMTPSQIIADNAKALARAQQHNHLSELRGEGATHQKESERHKPYMSERKSEFQDVFPDELPHGLPPLRGIEHRIDLIPGAPLPNRAAYRTNPEDTKEIQRQIQDLLAKGSFKTSSPTSYLMDYHRFEASSTASTSYPALPFQTAPPTAPTPKIRKRFNDKYKISSLKGCITYVNFKIGPYEDTIECDVVPMTVCHMLLGRPWQFDKKAIHDGYSNAYTFTVKDKKFELRPMTPSQIIADNAKALARAQQHNHLSELRGEGATHQKESERHKPYMSERKSEFQDVFPDELPHGLPPLRASSTASTSYPALPFQTAPPTAQTPKIRRRFNDKYKISSLKGCITYVNFKIGPYEDTIECDVVPMTVCHMLLGRPWQFDKKAIHDGYSNAYTFTVKDKKSFKTSSPTSYLMDYHRFEASSTASTSYPALPFQTVPPTAPTPKIRRRFNDKYKISSLKGCITYVNFKIGPYEDTIECDVVPMTVCHMLLGRPWQFDKKAIHDGYSNAYTFTVKDKKFELRPMTPSQIIADNAKALARAQQHNHLSELRGEGATHQKESERHKPYMSERKSEFQDVFPDELPHGLPPLRGIEHRIDLIPGAPLPNRAAYRTNPEDTKEIQQQIQDLLAKGSFKTSSPTSYLMDYHRFEASSTASTSYPALPFQTVPPTAPTPKIRRRFNDKYKISSLKGCITYVNFKIGPYEDTIECDVVPMTVCHMLLGRPWQFDKKAIHDGYSNAYTFTVKDKKFELRPMTPSQIIADNAKALARAQQHNHLSELRGEGATHQKESERHKPYMSERKSEFQDVFPDELPHGLPPLRGIEHRIDLIPGAPLPNRAAYRTNPEDTKEIQQQIQDLLAKGSFKTSSPMSYLMDYHRFEASSTASTSYPALPFQTAPPTAPTPKIRRRFNDKYKISSLKGTFEKALALVPFR
ncbi:hypothetical protein QYE76_032196 [Lolium multiflorum]|uniref:Uncharacterized protein n=1 Tax=Lolium multiflorum TaxID=4521 RepID=A0AAD8VL27_LOLMU|nr:hypothetical protein QYE76_032196 [Lolium multiflorum]